MVKKLKQYNDLITPANYAATRKPSVTPQNIYSLIRRGKLKAVDIDGVIFIKLAKK